MKRTQLQLDETTYRKIRSRAYQSGKSMAEEIRLLLRRALQEEGIEDRCQADPWQAALSVVGGFHTSDGKRDVSMRHDHYLTEADPV